MVRRRRKRSLTLYPRSFLATALLARILRTVSNKRGMTQSQLIRHALTEWLLYNHVKEAEKLREDGDGEEVEEDSSKLAGDAAVEERPGGVPETP